MLINDNLNKIKDLLSKREFCIERTNEDELLLNHEIKMCDNEISIRTLLNKIYIGEYLNDEDIEILKRYQSGYELYQKANNEKGIKSVEYRISSEELIGRIDNFSLLEQAVIVEKMSELKEENKEKYI